MVVYYEPDNIFAIDESHSTSYLLCADHLSTTARQTVCDDNVLYGEDDTDLVAGMDFPGYGEYEFLYSYYIKRHIFR